ncbi:MAG: hypothetical protein HY774_04410 [Acidobacteria bacterium]|nr:hypothetical protein [Acidobacteriota bacterium]
MKIPLCTWQWTNQSVVLLVLIALGIVNSDVVWAQDTTWVQRASNQEARQEVAVTEVQGRIYLIGGISNRIVSNTVERYDPVADTWARVAPVPERLHHTTAVSLNNRIFVIGGYNSLAFTPVASVYIFDPATNQWTEGPALPSPRGALACVTIDGKIYAVGGEGDQTTGELSVFDPTTNRWESLPPMPTPREHIAAGVIDGKLYVAGGRNSNSFTLTTLEVFDPATRTWQSRAPLPTGRSGIAGATVNGRFYVFGGEGNRNHPLGVFEENESYDPMTNSWRIELPMPTPRHGIGAVALNSRIYIPGGAPVQGFGQTTVHEVFVVDSTQPVNHPPVIEPIPDVEIRAFDQQCIPIRVTDPEGDAVNVNCGSTNPGFVQCRTGNPPEICLQPISIDGGTFQVCVVASDTFGNQSTACFQVTVQANTPPEFRPFQPVTMKEGDTFLILALAIDRDTPRDPEKDGKISLKLIEGTRFAKFVDNGFGMGELTLTPTTGDGTPEGKPYRLIFEATDHGTPPLSSTEILRISVIGKEVSNAPEILNVTYEGKLLTITGFGLQPSPLVEINGKVIPVAAGQTNASVVIIQGKKKKLNLKNGKNTITITVKGVQSRPFEFRL